MNDPTDIIDVASVEAPQNGQQRPAPTVDQYMAAIGTLERRLAAQLDLVCDLRDALTQRDAEIAALRRALENRTEP